MGGSSSLLWYWHDWKLFLRAIPFHSNRKRKGGTVRPSTSQPKQMRSRRATPVINRRSICQNNFPSGEKTGETIKQHQMSHISVPVINRLKRPVTLIELFLLLGWENKSTRSHPGEGGRLPGTSWKPGNGSALAAFPVERNGFQTSGVSSGVYLISCP